MSQRYCDSTNAKYRIPTDVENESDYKFLMDQAIHTYGTVKENYSHRGKKRSQEIARNFLPNVSTQIIQCRPLRQWQHFIDLRNTPHAQMEIFDDVQSLIKLFESHHIDIIESTK